MRVEWRRELKILWAGSRLWRCASHVRGKGKDSSRGERSAGGGARCCSEKKRRAMLLNFWRVLFSHLQAGVDALHPVRMCRESNTALLSQSDPGGFERRGLSPPSLSAKSLERSLLLASAPSTSPLDQQPRHCRARSDALRPDAKARQIISSWRHSWRISIWTADPIPISSRGQDRPMHSSTIVSFIPPILRFDLWRHPARSLPTWA